MRLISIMILCLAATWASAASGATKTASTLPAGTVVKACDDVAGFPPYVFKRRSNEPVTGFAVDYLQRILDRKKLRLEIDLLPTVRCAAGLESGDYDLLATSAAGEADPKAFLVSKPYFALTPVFFYATDRPKPEVPRTAALKDKRLCGTRTGDYGAFGLGRGDFDSVMPTLAEAFRMLQDNRCELIPDRLEPALGQPLIGGPDFQAQGLAAERLGDIPPLPYHVAISRHSAHAAELLVLVNEGIADLTDHQGAVDLAGKYGIPLPPAPAVPPAPGP